MAHAGIWYPVARRGLAHDLVSGGASCRALLPHGAGGNCSVLASLSHRSRVCSTHPRAECMRSFPSPGLTDSRTRSGLASAVATAPAAAAAACTLQSKRMCVCARSLTWFVMPGRSRDACEPHVIARRVCENVLNECELGPKDMNERETWETMRESHTPALCLSHTQKKRPRLHLAHACERALSRA